MVDVANVIHIQVSGYTKTGKTMIVSQIQETLSALGLDVEISGGPERPSESELQAALDKSEEIVSLCKPHIVIEEINKK